VIKRFEFDGKLSVRPQKQRCTIRPTAPTYALRYIKIAACTIKGQEIGLLTAASKSRAVAWL